MFISSNIRNILISSILISKLVTKASICDILRLPACKVGLTVARSS
jgi:hypothetical protein